MAKKNPQAPIQFLLSAHGKDQWPPDDRPEIAFVGRSNVGKSSCLNALVGGKAAARVSKTPGRTQAINFFELSRGGTPIRFADLPGYGFARVPKEVKAKWDVMIGEYLETRGKLGLVVVLVDLRHDPTPLDHNMVAWLEKTGRRGLLVFTKADKVSKSRRLSHQAKACKLLGIPREASLVFSAPDRMGRDELWARIEEVAREEGR